MSLQCQMTVNYTAYQAGQTPPPMGTLQVFNPNASAVAVTGIDISFFDTLMNPINAATNKPMPAMGPGQTVVVPALSSLTFGPFPLVFGSASNVDSFQQVDTSGSTQPVDRQIAHPPQVVVKVGATVTGSDGSVNTAGVAPILISYTQAPPVSFQGGFLNFASGNNLVLGLMTGVL